ncbi:MAG: nucleotidyltransferase family protein [Gemmatimonadales bacterium]
MTDPRQSPTVVVLAAGMGSRYGGLKQLDPVGPNGATLMDYSVYDARRAGFGKVVFVIRPDMEEAFRPFVSERYGSAIEVATAHQRREDIPAGVVAPPGRTKPWGTGQAVLAAESQVPGPFAVINADDFYGRAAYEGLAQFFKSSRDDTFALVGYRLSDTLSESGGVNRGVCRVTPEGWLDGIEEMYEIRRGADGAYAGRGSLPLRDQTLVSMNFWGFTSAVFGLLRRGLGEFFAKADLLKGEYLLPTEIDQAIQGHRARVKVLDAGSRWFGMTYPADRPAVSAAIHQLVADGVYPERLDR